MAGWSLFSDGSSSDTAETLQNLRSNGISQDSDQTSKLRCLFHLIHSHFCKEVSPKQEIMPLPVMMGDGRSVDLFKLYWIVKEKGGYDSVTVSGSWGATAEEAGVGTDVGAPIKLIYNKYLEHFDRWLWKVVGEKGIQWLWRIVEDKGIPGELDVETKCWLRNVLDGKNGHRVKELGIEKEVAKAPAGGNWSLGVNGSFSNDGDDDNDNDDDVLVLESHHENGVSSPLKRSPLKRMRKKEGEYVFGMLNWVKRIAKNPCDPAIRRALDGSKRNAQEVEYHKQARIVRKSLFLRRNTYSSVLSTFFRKRQKMHPSMYEDYGGSRDQSKLRSSQRLLFQHMISRSSSCSEASTATDNSDKNLSPLVSWMENSSDKQVLKKLGSLTAETVVCLFGKDQIQKRVPVGPQFQARVPEWTGLACNSGDSKWLGTQIWPLKPKELSSLIEEHSIGKGRPDSCNCKCPGSIECIRFHVAEKRFQLKRELGSAFYKWRFHHMGEEVSLSWTDEEERRFKRIVYRNPPSLDKSFWEEAYKSFYYKSRRSLVNYYFDVFLLRRRSYQNRETPNQIDSDDEESEFGSASSGFGHDAVEVHGLKSIMCSQNKQCMDLDESLNVDE